MANEIYETNFNFVRGDNYWTFSTTDYVWIKRIKAFLDKNPKSGIILHENADGSIVGRLFTDAVNIMPRAKRVLSDEQKKQARERITAWRSSKDINDVEFNF